VAVVVAALGVAFRIDTKLMAMETPMIHMNQGNSRSILENG
jgi:hypothetical protein